MSIILCFILMLFLGFIINYGIHLYYKMKRTVFFKAIGEADFIEIKDIDTEILGKSNFGWSCKYYKSDIIVYEGSFYLLLRNYNMDGLINQFQAIVQISVDESVLQTNGVDKFFRIDKSEVCKSNIKVYSEQIRVVKSMFTIALDFEDKPDDLDLIKSFLK